MLVVTAAAEFYITFIKQLSTHSRLSLFLSSWIQSLLMSLVNVSSGPAGLKARKLRSAAEFLNSMLDRHGPTANLRRRPKCH